MGDICRTTRPVSVFHGNHDSIGYLKYQLWKLSGYFQACGINGNRDFIEGTNRDHH